MTAISRFDSKSTFPQGVTIKQVDYSKPDTLVEALREQDALVVTLSGFAPKETQDKLAQAAGEAGVKWMYACFSFARS